MEALSELLRPDFTLSAALLFLRGEFVSSTDFLPKADRSLSLRLRPFLLELLSGIASDMLMEAQVASISWKLLLELRVLCDDNRSAQLDLTGQALSFRHSGMNTKQDEINQSCSQRLMFFLETAHHYDERTRGLPRLARTTVKVSSEPVYNLISLSSRLTTTPHDTLQFIHERTFS